MGKIIVLANIVNERQANLLAQKIEEVEKELGLEDEPLTVLNNQAAIGLINNILDLIDISNDCLNILNAAQTDKLPDGLEV